MATSCRFESGHRHQNMGYPVGVSHIFYAGRTRTAGESPGSDPTAAGGGVKGGERVAAVGEGRRCAVTEDIRRASQQDTGTKIATANDTNCIIGGSCFLIKTQYNKIVRAYSQIIMKGKGASNEKMYIINVCACYFCVPCFGWV